MAFNSLLYPEKKIKMKTPDEIPPDFHYKELGGLSLAFIGDAVYELMVREYILSPKEDKISCMHRKCVDLVNAGFQAKAIRSIKNELTEEEQTIFKRGRNAGLSHIPKNKTHAQYHTATGFEALIGYIYLKKDFERLNFLFSLILERSEADETKEE